MTYARLFSEHSGFAWRNDPRVLLSTSKDSTLFQYLMQDAVRPANHANALSVAHVLNASGDVAFASSDRFFGGEQASSTRGRPVHPPSARFPAVFKKAPSMSDQFCQATSSLVIFSNTTIEVGSFLRFSFARVVALCFNCGPVQESVNHEGAAFFNELGFIASVRAAVFYFDWTRLIS